MTLRTFAERTVRLRGRPFSLQDRPYLRAVYASRTPNLVIRGSRQIEKSTFLANYILYHANRFPDSEILFVAPRFDQANLFSRSRLEAVVLDSTILRRLLWPNNRRLPARDIEFANGAKVYIRSAFLNANANRGISASVLIIDEFQDLPPKSLEVLRETLSHAEDARILLTGTPTTVDNALETAFRDSTACEWHVPCPACNRSALMDERVIGPDGLICPQCQAPLDPRQGCWVPRNPGSTWGNGYWINHLMVPWLGIDDILERQRTYDRVRFLNEALGLPSSLGDHIITREEIEACCEDRPNARTLDDVPSGVRHQLVAGVDWGGGGKSRTVLAIGWIDRSLVFHIVRLDRWLPHEDPLVVIKEVAQRCRQFQVRRIAADGAGHGLTNNRLLYEQVGGPLPIFSIIYSNTDQAPRPRGVLVQWIVDRSETIGVLFSRIRLKLLRFPRVAESSSFLDEFVCEVAEYDDIMRTVRYTHPESQPDDCLHAVNYAELLARYLLQHATG